MSKKTPEEIKEILILITNDKNQALRKQLFPIIDSVMPLHQIAKAHQRLENGSTKDKVVLQVFES